MESDNKLGGKVAVITGIGRAIGLEMATHGARVVVADRFAGGDGIFVADNVWVSTYRESGLRYLPSGGWGLNGIGLERSREGVDEFLLTKSVHLKLRAGFGNGQ